MSRYVILRHEMSEESGRGLHWDFMLESQGVLRTWALAEEPRLDATIDAIPLPDHDLKYLEYEGDISGGRGRVARWDAGEFVIREQSDDRLILDLHGIRFCCMITAARQSQGESWQFTIGYSDSSPDTSSTSVRPER